MRKSNGTTATTMLIEERPEYLESYRNLCRFYNRLMHTIRATSDEDDGDEQQPSNETDRSLLENMHEIIDEAERAALETTRANLQDREESSRFQRRVKMQIVSFVALCAIRARVQTRDRRNQATANEARDEDRATKRDKSAKRRREQLERLCVDVGRDYESPALRLAAAMFCRAHLTATTGTRFNANRKLPSAHREMFREEILALHDSYEPTKLATLGRRIVVKSCIELADVLNDGKWSQIAFKMDPEFYFRTLRQYFENGLLRRSVTFKPMFETFVAMQVNQKEELRVLANQFNANREKTIEDVLKHVQQVLGGVGTAASHAATGSTTAVSASGNGNGSNGKVTTTTTTTTTNGKRRYVPNEIEAEVYVGPVNFVTDLTHEHVDRMGKRYFVTLYKDCLFDVQGAKPLLDEADAVAADETTDKQQQQQPTTRMFNDIPWSRRLELVPWRVKISLQRMTGREINEYGKQATLYLSFEKNGVYSNKTVTVRRNNSKKQPQQQQPQQ